MHTESLLALRLIFTALFALTLLAGVYLLRNHRRLFGVDPEMPSENASSRTYSALQIFVVWAHAVLLTGAFALMLH
jgi:hypothetical protein